jgi:hypothetical protein
MSSQYSKNQSTETNQNHQNPTSEQQTERNPPAVSEARSTPSLYLIPRTDVPVTYGYLPQKKPHNTQQQKNPQKNPNSAPITVESTYCVCLEGALGMSVKLLLCGPMMG